MLKSLYTTATGMKAQQTMVDMIANNIANVNTSGFKKSQASFEDLFYVTLQSPGLARGAGDAAVPIGTQIGSGTRLNGTTKVFTTGTLEITERSLDVAIDGDGFFSVILPDGQIAYTRDGSFHLNADGKLVTGAGNIVTPEITVPADTLEISVDPEGRVSGRTAGAPDTNTQFGQLQIHRFVNPSGMFAVGDNVMRWTDASGRPFTGTPASQGLGTLKQGFREGSNVNMAKELVDLQLLMKQQEMLTKVLAHFGMIVP